MTHSLVNNFITPIYCMRKMYYFIFALLTIVIASCNKDTIAYGNNYDKSYRAWLNFKDSSGNSYRYLVAQGSWTGYGAETIVTVKNGKIVQRSFVAKIHANNGTNAATILEQWNEDETQLSTHQNGAALLTLDDLYKEAKQNWLVKRDNADTYFEAKNHGMISSCGYVPNGCMDDCFNGINISFIEAI